MLDMQQLKELLLQSFEHERGGVNIYETAIRCAVSQDLKRQWAVYRDQTRTHVRILEEVFRKLGLDSEQHSPGRAIVRGLGLALVTAMERAEAAGGDPSGVQRVACECIVLAETKDHLNWELLTKCAGRLRGFQKRALEDACEIVEEQEDEHLYHSRGYCRELWLDALGLPAVLPPPEDEGMDLRGRATQARAGMPAVEQRREQLPGAVAEMQHVRSAVSAAQAQQQSDRNR